MTEQLKQFLAEKQETQQIKSGRKETTNATTAEQLKKLLLAKQLALEEYRLKPDCFYSLKEIQLLTGGKSRSTIYRWEKNGTIPASHKIGPNSIGWLKSEMDEWFSKFQGAA